jgi:hypothetical protein
MDCLEKGDFSFDDMKKEIQFLLGLLFSEVDFDAGFQRAMEEGKISFHDDKVSITAAQRSITSQGRIKGHQIESVTKEMMAEICTRLGVSGLSWERFRDSIILEHIRNFIVDDIDHENIFDKYIAEVLIKENIKIDITQIRQIVESLIDCDSQEIKLYLANNIYGYYNVESLGLTEEAVASLKPKTGITYNIRLLLDTNYLFSLLQLHENPSNDAVLSINAIISKINDIIKISYHITPKTIKEFQQTLTYEIKQISAIRFSIPIAKTIISTPSISGLTK